MKFHLALLAFASVSLGMASVVSAEPPIGSRIGDRTEKQQVKDHRDAVAIAHELAGCALTAHAAVARDLLNARDEDGVKMARQRLGGEEECIANFAGNDLVEGVRVSYPPDIMRGDIAEEILKREAASVARLQPLPIQKTYSRSWFAFTGRNLSVDEMATCVAETDPAGVMALLESTPQSPGEGAAFSTLIPYMGPCLVAGTKLEGAREPLRAALAEALYQRITNPGESMPAPPPATSTKAAPK